MPYVPRIRALRYGGGKRRTLFRRAARPMRFRAAPAIGKQGYFRLGGRSTRLLLKGQEKNFVDTTLTSLACDTTGSVTLVNVIAQGVTVNQRIGKKALLKSIALRGMIQGNSAATQNLAEVNIVYDSQSNGAAIPAITDIFTSAIANTFLNNDNSHRFILLKRISAVLVGFPSNVAPANETPSCNVDEWIKLDKEIEWNISAATGVQATIQKGAIYVVTRGTQAAGTSACAFNGTTRVRFTEDY